MILARRRADEPKTRLLALYSSPAELINHADGVG